MAFVVAFLALVPHNMAGSLAYYIFLRVFSLPLTSCCWQAISCWLPASYEPYLYTTALRTSSSWLVEHFSAIHVHLAISRRQLGFR